jgi:hypothetical protein
MHVADIERPWFFHTLEDIVKSLNLTNFFGRVLSEGDNNLSRAILTGAILNMTHHMYNRTEFLPGVPNPFEAPGLA